VGAEFLHAWEMKDVERWLYSEGLSEAMHAFRKAGIKGEDLLDMNADNVAAKLADVDEATVMRICAALLPLKHVWKHSRWAAGLKVDLKPPKPFAPPQLVADLHVLVDGASHLPPGASGAYVEMEVGEHKIKSAFLPAPPPTYYEAGRAAYSPFPVIESPHPHIASYSLPHEPQAFRISLDKKDMADVDGIALKVIAWIPHKGEVECGKVEIPVPAGGNGAVQLIRIDRPVRAELQWVGYHTSVEKSADDWQVVAEAEEPRLAPLEGAWYTPYDDHYLAAPYGY